MVDKLTEIQETLIQVGLRIAKRGEGALFVVGHTNYEELVDQNVPSFNISNNPKLLESLAIMDGAIIIDENGMLKAYGVMVKSGRTFRNFGTRHSAAVSASKTAKLIVMVSEEDKKVRIFQNEKMIMQIDAMQKNVEANVSNAVNILESVGAGALGTIGTGLLAPSIGIALLPGIVLFGGAYYTLKRLSKK